MADFVVVGSIIMSAGEFVSHRENLRETMRELEDVHLAFVNALRYGTKYLRIRNEGDVENVFPYLEVARRAVQRDFNWIHNSRIMQYDIMMHRVYARVVERLMGYRVSVDMMRVWTQWLGNRAANPSHSDCYFACCECCDLLFEKISLDRILVQDDISE